MYSIWYWDESLGFESHGNLSRSTLLWVWLIQNLTQLLSVFLVSTIVELWDSEAFELIDLFVFSFRRRPLLRLTLHSILPNLFSHPPSPSCDELGVGTWYLSINQPSSATFALWKYHMSLSCYIILPAQYLISSLTVVTVHDKTNAWWVFPLDLRA